MAIRDTATMSKTAVTLRNTKDKSGSRFLEASLDERGVLRIIGQDMGHGVENYYGIGISEYEWIWTVAANDMAKLAKALGASGVDGVLELLKERFSGPNADQLKAFLDDNQIPHAVWSRVGD